jgi:hypothetical protein
MMLLNQMKSPAAIGVPLKFDVIVDPGSAACATEFSVMPAAASTPSPVLTPVVARNPLRVNVDMDILRGICLSKDCAFETDTLVGGFWHDRRADV